MNYIQHEGYREYRGCKGQPTYDTDMRFEPGDKVKVTIDGATRQGVWIAPDEDGIPNRANVVVESRLVMSCHTTIIQEMYA